MNSVTIKLGTRRSALALWQTKNVVAELEATHPDLSCEIVEIVTSGDKKQNDVTSLRDKKEWIVELEAELLAGRIDLAVHSGKDVPIDIEKGTTICSVQKRASAFDAYVLRDELRSIVPPSKGEALDFLPPSAVVGTASARRGAQLLSLRPDLNIAPIRGNVPTRIKKLQESETMSAIVLAEAGLKRLGLEEQLSGVFTSSELLPAVNQGILVVQYLESNTEVAKLISKLVVPDTQLVFATERKIIEFLGADCRSCIGVFAEVLDSGELRLEVSVFSPDGSEKISASGLSAADDWQSLAESVAEQLKNDGAIALLQGSSD